MGLRHRTRPRYGRRMGVPEWVYTRIWVHLGPNAGKHPLREPPCAAVPRGRSSGVGVEILLAIYTWGAAASQLQRLTEGVRTMVHPEPMSLGFRGPEYTLGMLLHGFGAGRESPILGVLGAPPAPKTIPKSAILGVWAAGRRPHTALGRPRHALSEDACARDPDLRKPAASVYWQVTPTSY